MALVELAEGIAHDLKNQLTIVAASVQLAREMGPERRPELLDRAWRSAMRAARLMDDMLQYARGGRAPTGEADVGEALETAVAGALGDLAARSVELEMRTEPGLPPAAVGPAALRLLLLHWLRWAASGLPPGTRLVASAAPWEGGIAVDLQAVAPSGREELPSPAEVQVPAALQALAAQVGAGLRRTQAAGTRCGLWLPAADARPAVGRATG
jgi:hypothetical protein